MPAAILDLRFEAPGFAPHYAWSVDATSGRAELGELVLMRGASVGGWVREGDRDSGDGVTVTLTAQTDGPARNRTVKPNARGFFQFTDVAPGAYDIAAEKKGRSPARLSGIAVRAGREELLRDPLVIRPLAAIDLVIQPPLGPEAKPWAVVLSRVIPYSTYYEPVAQGRAGIDGRWNAGSLEEAAYVLDIRDGNGTEFTHRRIEVSGDMPPLVVTLDVIPVRGRLHAGDAPLRGRVKLTTSAGEEAVFAANDEGEFSGVVGREGAWRSEVRLPNGQSALGPPVTVRRRDGEEYAKIDIELPDGRLAGHVVDEQGKGVVRAGVIVTQGGAPVVDVLTNDDGAFELIGLRRAPALISAQARGAESGALPVAVSDDAAPVTLTLRANITVEGRLTGPHGMPVAGARIVYSSPTLQFRPQVNSSPSGAFRLKLPGGTAAVELAIIAPGLPIKLTSVVIPEDRQLHILLGEAAGRLLIRPGGQALPVLIRDGVAASLQTLITPPFGGVAPPEFTPEGIDLRVEPGHYAVCPEARISDGCVPALALAGTTTKVAIKQKGPT
ncbi:MAG TPA: carboxypeptidase-like regulatory domain-containing protein [Thermoanaerobaculia bacterium]|nr:carboxypeptidase-like regulatory domain-containing protein [Thermoanaerobaculia bacterium]